jgi:O-antigen ligase
VTVFLSNLGAFAAERLTATDPVEGRIIGGAATVRMIVQKPVFGWGYDNHERYDEQFRTDVLGLDDPAAHTSHHTYLLLTAEMGVVGLLLYLLPPIWLLGETFSRWRQVKPVGLLGRSMLVMLWLLLADHFLVGNFTDLIRSNFFSTSMWWLILGWIANILQNAMRTGTPEGQFTAAYQLRR